MGEISRIYRIFGGSAGELLKRIVERLPSTASVSIAGGLTVFNEWHIGLLETRLDGVVELAVELAGSSFDLGALPAEWLVYQETSCSKGIDYESITLARGSEILFSLCEMPDGDLVAQVGDRVIEEVRRLWTEDGERIAGEGDEVTWEAFRDRHLARIASTLGNAAVVLHASDTGAIPPTPRIDAVSSEEPTEQPLSGSADEDDIPF